MGQGGHFWVSVKMARNRVIGWYWMGFGGFGRVWCSINF